MSKKKKRTRDYYEEGRDPDYSNWKSDNRARQLREDKTRLQKEVNINASQIIDIQDELIRRYEYLLDQMTERFTSQENYYQQLIKQKLDEYEKLKNNIEQRIVILENQVEIIQQEVNSNTERLNNLIDELNKEKRRVSRLARKACNDAITVFNELSANKIYIKMCYYRMINVEHSISIFSEPDLAKEALYAVAIDTLGTLAEIKALADLEWNKFLPAYVALQDELKDFENLLKKSKEIPLDEWPDIIIDTDFWTGDLYTELCKRAQQLIQRISVGKYAKEYMCSDIKQDSDNLKMLRDELEQVTAQAKRKASQARNRHDAGVQVLKYLMSQGFSESISQFEENDERRSYVIEAIRFIDERKITLVFTPDTFAKQAQCIIRHQHYLDPNEFSFFVRSLVESIQTNCGVFCSLPNREVEIASYDDDTLTPNGIISETLIKSVKLKTMKYE